MTAPFKDKLHRMCASMVSLYEQMDCPETKWAIDEFVRRQFLEPAASLYSTVILNQASSVAKLSEDRSGPRLDKSKEWFEKKIEELEGSGVEIGAGLPADPEP